MKRLLMKKNEPVFEAVASKGPGVFETLKGVAKLVLSRADQDRASRRSAACRPALTRPERFL